MSAPVMSRSIRPAERGAALMVVLMLLLVMTLLGLASMRMTVMEERMSASMYDRGLSFQAAEAALREAEAIAQTGPAFPATGSTCSGGLCTALAHGASGTIDRWLDPDFAGWRGASNPGAITATPDYIIEHMGEAPNWPGCDREAPVHPRCLSPRYRITARSSASDRALVVLQSSYLPR